MNSLKGKLTEAESNELAPETFMEDAEYMRDLKDMWRKKGYIKKRDYLEEIEKYYKYMLENVDKNMLSKGDIREIYLKFKCAISQEKEKTLLEKGERQVDKQCIKNLENKIKELEYQLDSVMGDHDDSKIKFQLCPNSKEKLKSMVKIDDVIEVIKKEWKPTENCKYCYSCLIDKVKELKR